MRCAVTGGAGYIGSVTTALLADAGHDVVVIDNLSTGHRDAVSVPLVEADLRDTEAMVKALKGVDAVIHFAAKSIVPESVAHPDLYWDNNVGGSTSLLAAMREAGVHRLVFSSTAATYGDPARVPIREQDATEPTNPYGQSKLATDQAISQQAAEGWLAAASLRYFNVAGAHGQLSERHDPETHLIPVVLNGLGVADSAPVRVFGTDWDTPDGTCVRDYVHVVDLARAHLLALDVLVTGEHQIVNLGSGSGFSVLEVIGAVERVTGLPVPWEAAPRRPGDPQTLVASIERAAELLGWEPRLSLDEMIADAWRVLRSRSQRGL